MELKVELQFYRDNLDEWLAHHAGKYVLIKEQELGGFFDSAESAFSEGAVRWGNTPFLVRKVAAEEEVEQSPALMFGLIHANF